MILLPDDAEWADDYIESMTRFPKGQHDDDVDSTSQALNYLRRRQPVYGLRPQSRWRPLPPPQITGSGALPLFS
jgi:hypothetical protein